MKYIYPGQTDTVTFYRLRTDPAAFEPPCGDSIYFKINLRDQFYRGLQIATDTIKYECDA